MTLRERRSRAAGLLALAGRASAFHPDSMHFGGHTNNAPFGNRGAGGAGGELNALPIYYVVPFVLLIVATIAMLIWFIVSDEKKEARQQALDKRASSLKFGRADPRYYE
jgi:hypothetical protein